MTNIFLKTGEFSIPKIGNKNPENIVKTFNIDDKGNCACFLVCAHDGNDVAEYLVKYLHSSFDDLKVDSLISNVKVKEFLKETFNNFEEAYIKSLRKVIHQRDTLCEKSKNDENFLEYMQEYEEIERQLRCGCTIAALFFINNEFYVVNIGDNQLLILLEDKSLLTYTDEHNFYNTEEIQRIVKKCGLNASALSSLFGITYSRYHSRCLGHYEMKKEYNKIDNFKSCKSPPIISEPQIISGIQVDKKWQNIIFISSGLYYLVMDLIYDRDKIAGEIANEFLLHKEKQDDISKISEMIVRKYYESHMKAFEQNSLDPNQYQHEELTIMAIELKLSSQFVPDSFSSLSKSLTNSLPTELKSYVNFEKWLEVESKLTKSEKDEIHKLIIVKIEDNPVILEEDESSHERISRSVTIENEPN